VASVSIRHCGIGVGVDRIWVSNVSRAILDLQNRTNWAPFWSGEVESVRLASGSHVPLPTIEVPVLFDNHIVAILADSETAKRTWKIAGNVGRKIQTGILFNDRPDTSIADNRVLRLFEINLFRFEQISSTYSLEITPKFWIEDIKLDVFIYTGINSDSITEQLNRIEADLDAILR
jgi:hypothetical protein